ncbi:Cytoplasmic alpha-amylase [Planctomycetales bacterium 10988]|nr:Cytoplasmic alpha-amylase [Planctomycetales bacterium 10988]
MMKRSFVVALLVFAISSELMANPWNGKVVLQAYWWDCWNNDHPNDWYTYLAKLSPRLKAMGFDGIWVPSPCKGAAGTNDMGFTPFDYYDLGDKHQKGTTTSRFGTKDSFLRMVAVAHANGLEVYSEVVLNHCGGGDEDPQARNNKHKKFRYRSFLDAQSGRWPKDWWNFHPNDDHNENHGVATGELAGPDICYLDHDHGGGGNGRYMLDQARQWFVWYRKQSDVDGFCFDAVKHFPAFVVEDLLYNAMRDRKDFFAVGEFLGSGQQLDQWVDFTKNRCGTFDFGFRSNLAQVVNDGGFYKMGMLPDSQQSNRLKTVPFINNHDTWRGWFWDSNPGSNKHDDRDGDWRQNKDEEVGPTIDPDNPRADVAYAAAFAVDGSPMVFYEDLFRNFDGDTRYDANPETHPTRKYLENLVWCHQKLNFKNSKYRIPFRGSDDLLVIERAGKAIIGLNDHGTEAQHVTVQTSFGAEVKLHDYSGSTSGDVTTDADGKVHLSVPPMSYAIWGPTGISGGFQPAKRRTTQEFQMDDDLGDSESTSLQYGGKIAADQYRTAGSVWIAKDTPVKVWLYTDGLRRAQLQILKPAADGSKASNQSWQVSGPADNHSPLYLEFTADREGYYQLQGKLDTGEASSLAWLKVEYEAPAESDKF